MKRLLDQLLGERTRAADDDFCRDTSAAERRHAEAMREGERALQRAERSIREAVAEIQAAHDSWERMFGRDEGGRR